ncbi:MAG: hypothetical protein HKN07_07825 [Acidimicrobiia bacterium]|nr:hypothetical protein [Acidimicrobiia bacterium]RZV48579.1 MAG: hypothetical protein EX269_01010 [Acidimicrobiales bacterium]
MADEREIMTVDQLDTMTPDERAQAFWDRIVITRTLRAPNANASNPKATANWGPAAPSRVVPDLCS